ncbi:MAG: hypothetical protein ACRDRR_16130 [Pseudonocardiaceae bacterium]
MRASEYHRPAQEGVVAVPVRDRHGFDAQREYEVRVGETDRDDGLRLGRDRCGAVLVRDGDREARTPGG